MVSPAQLARIAAAQLCWFRDWFLQNYDAAIAARSRVPAEVG